MLEQVLSFTWLISLFTAPSLIPTILLLTLFPKLSSLKTIFGLILSNILDQIAQL